MFVEAAVMLSQGHAQRLAYCLDGQCRKYDFFKSFFFKRQKKNRHYLVVALMFSKFTSKQLGDFDGYSWTCDFVYRTRAIITSSWYIFYPILKSISFFSRRFYQKFLSLCIVSIEERFVIKSGL